MDIHVVRDMVHGTWGFSLPPVETESKNNWAQIHNFQYKIGLGIIQIQYRKMVKNNQFYVFLTMDMGHGTQGLSLPWVETARNLFYVSPYTVPIKKNLDIELSLTLFSKLSCN